MEDEKKFENEENAVEETVEETVDETAAVTENAVSDAVDESAADAVDDAQGDAAEVSSDDVAAKATSEIAADLEETVNQFADEAAQAAAEAAESDVPETADGFTQMSETEMAVAQALAARDAEDAAKNAVRKSRNTLIAVIAAVVIVIGGAVVSGFVSKDSEGSLRINSYSGWLPKLVNKYNHQGYIDSTGNTLGDIINQVGVTLPEFLEMYDLPADMPKSTSEMAVIYNMPAGTYLNMTSGLDYDSIKEQLNIPDTAEDGTELTEDTAWGIVEGEIAVKDYIGGEENLEEFKENYELGDEVTGDTKWKDVRNAIDSYTKKQREESEKAAAEESTSETTEEDETEATPEATAEAAEATAEAK